MTRSDKIKYSRKLWFVDSILFATSCFSFFTSSKGSALFKCCEELGSYTKAWFIHINDCMTGEMYLYTDSIFHNSKKWYVCVAKTVSYVVLYAQIMFKVHVHIICFSFVFYVFASAWKCKINALFRSHFYVPIRTISRLLHIDKNFLEKFCLWTIRAIFQNIELYSFSKICFWKTFVH